MSSQASSSHQTKTRVDHKYSCGTLMELLRVEWAVLLLMDYDDHQPSLKFLRHGEFIIQLIMQATGSIVITVCEVDSFRWPVTKDSPIISVGKRSFVFATPGLLYGLRFGPQCREEKIDILERVFMKYGHYEDHSAKAVGIAYEKLAQFGHFLGKSLCEIGNQSSFLLNAIRMCATTELLSKALLSGVIRPMHTDIYETRPTPTHKKINCPHAFPTISLFTNSFADVELIVSGIIHLIRNQDPVMAEPVAFKVWCLNKEGLSSFFQYLSSVCGELEERNENENVEIAGGNLTEQEVNNDRSQQGKDEGEGPECKVVYK